MGSFVSFGKPVEHGTEIRQRLPGGTCLCTYILTEGGSIYSFQCLHQKLDVLPPEITEKELPELIVWAIQAEIDSQKNDHFYANKNLF